MKEPSHRIASKCIELRRKRKQDIDIGDDEYVFCSKVFGNYPEWYLKVEGRVFGTWTRFMKERMYEEETTNL
jgi:hypothetical protein